MVALEDKSGGQHLLLQDLEMAGPNFVPVHQEHVDMYILR